MLASVVAPDTDQPLTDAIHLDHPGRAYAQVDGAGRVRVDVASDGDLDWRLTVREWVAGRYHPLDAQAGSQAEFPQWLLGPVGCGETAGEADED